MARAEWQEEAEQENKKKVELAIKEHQSIWEKRYIIPKIIYTQYLVKNVSLSTVYILHYSVCI